MMMMWPEIVKKRCGELCDKFFEAHSPEKRILLLMYLRVYKSVTRDDSAKMAGVRL